MLQYVIYNVVARNISGATAAEIAASIEQAIHSGAIGPAQPLPAIRHLAETLRVSPVTVAAAYRLLHGRGLATGDGRRGTRIRPIAERLGAVAHATRPDGLIDLATGNPDPQFLPSLQTALRTVPPATPLYGDALQLRALVALAAAEFAADGLPAGPITITGGALDAIDRILREHLRPGDRVAVEDPTLPAVLDLLASSGLIPSPFAIDGEGPEPESFARALERDVRSAIVTPRAQNPSGAALTAARAADLRQVLQRRSDVVLIENDPAGPIAGSPAVSLVDSTRPHWAVIRSVSKFLGPDLRVAVMVADERTSARVQMRQSVGPRWVSHLLQHLVVTLWSDPANGRRLARASEVYGQRRAALAGALATRGVDVQPRSGFNVWIPVPEETAVVQALAARGWAVAAGERFRVRSRPAIRVTTSALEPDQAERFAADLVASLRSPASTLA